MTDPDPALQERTDAALDGLLQSLVLEPVGSGDRFEAVGEPNRFGRVFGGQLLAQSLLAASATVEDKAPHSLHAYFVEGGVPHERLELAVERIRDGRSISSRRVSVRQDGRDLLVLIASFHSSPVEPSFADPAPSVPPPDQLPLLQDWVRACPPDYRPAAESSWVEKPPPLEIRMGEALRFLGGKPAHGPRSHWMRVPRALADDPLLHTALLAYASDYFLLDMVYRAHPSQLPAQAFTATSLDHAVWFHRPARFDEWLVHTQQEVAISGDRGLVRGAIHNRDGQLIASVMQEVLMRPVRLSPAPARTEETP